MAFNPQKLLNSCNPDPKKAGKTLLVLNALGMVFAAASNTFAAAIDKNTSAEDKKFLVPAGAVTGVANIALYYAMTDKIINKLKESAEKTVKEMKKEDLTKKATTLAENMVKKAEKTLFKGKNHEEYAKSMKATLFDNGKITQKAKDLYKDKAVASAGVLGAFVGAVVGCAILTPIIRDVSAYFVQKKMEKNNPNLKTEPYKPYINVGPMNANTFNRQPLTMKNYISSTSSAMKI